MVIGKTGVNMAANIPNSDLIKQLQALSHLQQLVALSQTQRINQVVPVVTSGAVPALKYGYRVKIINPLKKSEIIIRELHNFHLKFESFGEITLKLPAKFEDQLPSKGNDFNIGYYDGPHHAKVSLISSDDLSSLYNKHSNGGEIVLWCDGKGTMKRKRNELSRLDKEDDA
uniref:Uncharacterized protein n=1 Tax=Amphimedon queenslandica TaxID=400682 RepID=A0A1X7VUS6_AMPQE